MPDARLLLIHPAAPFAEEVAQRLLKIHQDQLPDLSRLTLVIASPALLRPLRAALTRLAGGAMLGPRILTAKQFAAEALPADSPTPCSPLACRLQLAEWLTRLRAVFPDQEPAPIADALFALFEELTQNAARLPDDPAAWAAQLRAAYDSPSLEALSREAQIVHWLWRAYVDEIGDRAPAVAYLRGLRCALSDANAGTEQCYWLGFDTLTRAEAALMRTAIHEGRASFWTQGREAGRDGEAVRALLAALAHPPEHAAPDTASPRTRLLDACYDDAERSASFRAAALHTDITDSSCGLRLVAAGNAEHEARIVDLAVREALLIGARRVAVVSADRRLARRLRALLERAGLGLEDRVGWALSTSRAAAALASWLECLETGFHYRPLLDLLKCGFYVGQTDHPADNQESAERPEPRLAARLEREVLYRARGEPPVAGLRAFSQALNNALPLTFERLHKAAAELPVNSGARPGADWATAILASLKTLGLSGGLANDDAGSQLLAALAQLETALTGVPLRLRWSEFRRLLDRHLEEATFRAAAVGSGVPRVALYTLEQTQGLEADAIVLASATRAALPGAAPFEAFFNQSVRNELGLGNWPQRQAQTLMRLRRVLEAAPTVTITYAAGSDGEAPQASAWLDALAAFAAAAGFAPLHDAKLAARALSAEAQIAIEEGAAPTMPASMPEPPAAPQLLDFALSASSHQALIDCPYRFHVRSALRLYAEQAPDEAVSRADYGDRVHLILRAFHVHHDRRLPAPYHGPLNAEAVPAVTAKLGELADAVFANDLAERALAKAWRHEFANLAPWLAGQLIERGDADSVQVEHEQPRPAAGWTVKGVIDRLEHRATGASVIDYKTGRVAKPADILSGEVVQLPHYALTVDAPQAVAYWDLKTQAVIGIDGEPLRDLIGSIEQRLATLRQDLASGHTLAAHGDDTACSRCEYAGICRREAWLASANAANA